MRVLVSGGGTAGHVYPALAVAALVAADDNDQVAFVGAPDSLEQRLATDAGLRFHAVRASGWDRSRPWTLLTGIARAATSVLRCASVLRGERPDVVVGFGGYVSVPLALAAQLAGVPLVLHEQNSVPGVANRFLSRAARAVCLTYEGSRRYLKRTDRVVVTGNPVRDAVLRADRAAGRTRYGAGPGDVLVLVFGGSRGARHLNTAIVNLYSRLMDIEGVRVVHVAGPNEAAAVQTNVDVASGGSRDRWTVLDYVDGMGDLLAAADLVVCRSGATTLAEVAALGKPAVLVPYPYATDDHQTRNAEPFVGAGAALVFDDASIDGDAFAQAVTGLARDAGRRAAMGAAAASLGRPDAAADLLGVVRRIAAGLAPTPAEGSAL